MSRNGTSPLVDLEDMDDQELQIIAIKCFHILATRWGKDLQEVIFECYVDIDHEAELAKLEEDDPRSGS